MTDLSKLKLFATRPHPCSYLPGKDATTVFIDPAAAVDSSLYGELSRYGFRRSGANIYRPNCEACQACIPIRIAAESFQANRSQKRCIKANNDLVIRSVNTIDSDEHYKLYENYINSRHKDGDMFPADRQQYREFLTSEWGATRLIEMRDQEHRLVAVAVLDVLDHALSAVYTYFDSSDHKRSLGVFSILYQIQIAREHNLPFVYLGYWIRNCQKMNYKTNYQPYQILVNNHWVTISRENPLVDL